MSPDYRELFDLLDQVEKLTVKEWPAELPPETAPGFWEKRVTQSSRLC